MSNLNPIVVVEPNGPLNFGLSYYMKSDLRIEPASKFVCDTLENVIFVDENLGVDFYERKLNTQEQSELKNIPFVGLNIFHK
jgi:hypothetical protein